MTWKELLNKCNEAYSLGEVYVLTEEDVTSLEQETGLQFEAGSLVSDKVYDQIYYKCKELTPSDPFFSSLTSINTGYGVDVTLPVPAGSLDECKLGDLVKWLNPEKEYVVTEKLDGCSMVLFYENIVECFAQNVEYLFVGKLQIIGYPKITADIS